jgi:hypothetical protein
MAISLGDVVSAAEATTSLGCALLRSTEQRVNKATPQSTIASGSPINDINSALAAIIAISEFI